VSERARPSDVQGLARLFFRETNVSTLRELAVRAVAQHQSGHAKASGLRLFLTGQGVYEFGDGCAESHSGGRAYRSSLGCAMVRRVRRDTARGAGSDPATKS
jgi:hypothetical protein